ncbi:MAG: hypothetical protein R6X02_29645 [Enhygromyxa sp.]
MNDPTRRPYFHEYLLSFEAHGYFFRPLSPGQELAGLGQVRARRWHELHEILERAKRGDVSGAARVLELYRESHREIDGETDLYFEDTAITILGDIGSVELFKEMRREIEAPAIREANRDDYLAVTKVKDYCRAFTGWGRLDAVPVILDQYLNLRMKRGYELGILPCHISDFLIPAGGSDSMIQVEPPHGMLEDYLNLVMDRYDEMVAELGGEQVYVAFARRLSARTLAQMICAPVNKRPRFELMFLRRRFEPMTGIDCTDFFTADPWTPLAAAAIAEDFLASAHSYDYEEGVRYFFGHRLPD